jgi:hypothetical protein
MFVFLRGYFQTTKVILTDKKDGIKYISSLQRKKIYSDEFLVCIFKVENTKKSQKKLTLTRKVPFNIIIEKDGEILFKRDITDSVLRDRRNIRLGMGSKLSFTYLWDLIDQNGNKVEPGIYQVIIYNKDFDINHGFDFEIIEEAAK